MTIDADTDLTMKPDPRAPQAIKDSLLRLHSARFELIYVYLNDVHLSYNANMDVHNAIAAVEKAINQLKRERYA